jgi:archaellum biogenesis ATPase FlaH
MTGIIRDYSEDVQGLFISVLLSDEEIFARIQNILKANYFVNKYRPVVRYILDFADQYRALPKFVQIKAQFAMEFEEIDRINPAQQQAFLDHIEEFCKNRAIADAVLSAPELIQQGNYSEVEKRVKEAILVGLNSNVGIQYYENPRERLIRIKDSNGTVSSSWKLVDEKLYGGLNRKELTLWTANSGGGKSVTMQNQAVNMSRAGLNVVYISLELSEEMISMRLDSMVSGVANKDIFKNLDEVEIRVLQAGKKAAHLHVKQMPQGTTTNDLRVYLKNYEIETGHRCDVLIVDYLDLMFPNNKKIDVSNLYIKDKFICEELRGLCVEKNMVGISASQLGRCLTLDTVVIRDGLQTPIVDLKPGDRIQGSEGLVLVTHVMPVMKQIVFEIKTTGGQSIKASSKHLFPTPDGEKNLQDGLTIGDKLRICHANPTWDTITNIECCGFQDTIDITVDNDHLFWANNILTHNSSVNELEIDHSHIAGGISKIQTADNVIAILATPAMRERGQYQFQFLKTRSSSGVGSKVNMGYSQETLRIFDMEQDAQPAQQLSPQDMLADLRRKNSLGMTIDTENKQSDQAHKPEPSKSTSALKELTALIKR